MKIRLTDLDPKWVYNYDPVVDSFNEEGGSLSIAQGIMFDVPTGEGYSVLLWFRNRGIPDTAYPLPGRWDVVSGDSFDNLTLNPSIDLSCGGKKPGKWHGWIKNGEVT